MKHPDGCKKQKMVVINKGVEGQVTSFKQPSALGGLLKVNLR